MLCESGRCDEAVALYDQALAHCPDVALPALQPRRRAGRPGTPARCARCYGRCLQLDPAFVDAHYNAARLHDHLGHTQKAHSPLQRLSAPQVAAVTVDSSSPGCPAAGTLFRVASAVTRAVAELESCLGVSLSNAAWRACLPAETGQPPAMRLTSALVKAAVSARAAQVAGAHLVDVQRLVDRRAQARGQVGQLAVVEHHRGGQQQRGRDWRCPCRRCRAPSRAPLRRSPHRRRCWRPAPCRGRRPGRRPGRTGCRRTGWS